MNPINYASMLAVENPFDASLRGFSTANTMVNTIRQNREQELIQEARRQALLQEQIKNQDLAEFSKIPNPTVSQYRSLMTKHPSLTTPFKNIYDSLEDKQKQQMSWQAQQVHAALLQDRPDIAKKILKDHADAYKDAGDIETSQHYDSLLSLLENNPQGAKITSAALVAGFMGQDKYATTFENLIKAQTATESAPFEIKKSQAEADTAELKAQAAVYEAPKTRAEAELKQAQADVEKIKAKNAPIQQDLENRLNQAKIADYANQIQARSEKWKLDQEKLEAELTEKLQKNINPTLEKDARDIINQSTAESISSAMKAERMLEIAKELEVKAGSPGGILTKGSELLKSVLGANSEESYARMQAIQVMNQEVIATLPPGNASNYDMQIARQGVPPKDADAAYIAAWLRGHAQLSKVRSDMLAMRAEWVGQVGSTTAPRRDIKIKGIQVQRGTQFTDFYKTYADKMQGKETSPSTASQRSYMKYATGGK